MAERSCEEVAREIWHTLDAGSYLWLSETSAKIVPIIARFAAERERAYRELCDYIIAADVWPRPLGAPSAEHYIAEAASKARTALANANADTPPNAHQRNGEAHCRPAARLADF